MIKKSILLIFTGKKKKTGKSITMGPQLKLIRCQLHQSLRFSQPINQIKVEVNPRAPLSPQKNLLPEMKKLKSMQEETSTLPILGREIRKCCKLAPIFSRLAYPLSLQYSLWLISL